MAATALTVTSPAAFSEGLADVGFESADQTNGNSFANDGYTVLLIANGDASQHTATITAKAGAPTYNEAFTKTLTVAASGQGIMGPFPTALFNQSDGTVLLDWDDDTSVTVAAVSLKSAFQTPR